MEGKKIGFCRRAKFCFLTATKFQLHTEGLKYFNPSTAATSLTELHLGARVVATGTFAETSQIGLYVSDHLLAEEHPSTSIFFTAFRFCSKLSRKSSLDLLWVPWSFLSRAVVTKRSYLGLEVLNHSFPNPLQIMGRIYYPDDS